MQNIEQEVKQEVKSEPTVPEPAADSYPRKAWNMVKGTGQFIYDNQGKIAMAGMAGIKLYTKYAELQGALQEWDDKAKAKNYNDVLRQKVIHAKQEWENAEEDAAQVNIDYQSNVKSVEGYYAATDGKIRVAQAVAEEDDDDYAPDVHGSAGVQDTRKRGGFLPTRDDPFQSEISKHGVFGLKGKKMVYSNKYALGSAGVQDTRKRGGFLPTRDDPFQSEISKHGVFGLKGKKMVYSNNHLHLSNAHSGNLGAVWNAHNIGKPTVPESGRLIQT